MTLVAAFRIGLRYFRSPRRIGSPVFSVAGIAAGVMTLVAVLAVMNGFQFSFIEPILEVRSYHLQVRGLEDATGLRSVPGVVAVTPFVDLQALAGGRVACVLRALEVDPRDSGFRAAFDAEYGLPHAALAEGTGTVVLGTQLAARLAVVPGDTVSFFGFATGPGAEGAPQELELRVVGLFKTGYYDLDLNWALTSLETVRSLSPALGVKLEHPSRDREAAQQIRERFGPSVTVESWRDLNRLLFTALKTEKAVMMLLIGLVFVVVALNIFHSLERAVREREEEIATLRALGASAQGVRFVFVFEGLLIGIWGAALGNALGLLVSCNVNEIFRGAEALVNRVILPLAAALVRPFAPAAALGEWAVFSPRVFYIDRIPARVLAGEALAGSALAIACSLSAAASAARRVSEVLPQEVLRRV